MAIMESNTASPAVIGPITERSPAPSAATTA